MRTRKRITISKWWYRNQCSNSFAIVFDPFAPLILLLLLTFLFLWQIFRKVPDQFYYEINHVVASSAYLNGAGCAVGGQL